MNRYLTYFLIILSFVVFSTVNAEERLRMATTTSTDNSGLLSVLNPPFEKQFDVKVDVIAVGTGKALRLGMNGDVDLVFVHAPQAEQSFVDKDYGIEREPVMHNDFILIGPEADPADVTGAANPGDALMRINKAKATFISRGDDSGTHKKEKQLWKLAGSVPEDEDWYLSVGQGMGTVLRIATDKQAYTLTDRGTYLAYKDKMNPEIVYEHDALLKNPYHIILVNPVKHPHVKIDIARKYSEYVRGEAGQKIISEFRINGEQLFHPDVIGNP
jgi:tungstate transport system substrate-binding protein